jgi:undecaprenyl diphosphate synthase
MKNVSEGLPRHIGIIMDGNGRWAEQRGLPRIEGHRIGEEAIMETVRACAVQGIENLTIFAFSTENWQRPPEEVTFLVNMSRDVLRRRLEEFNSLGVRLLHLGLREELPPDILRWFDLAAESTRANRQMLLCIAFNYGGRKEIFDAAMQVAEGIARDELAEDEVDEETMRRNFIIPELPDIDLLIRTGGERRLSNFMLWHCAYAELYFTEMLWPDFRAGDLEEALQAYRDRDRRFGAISE